ncbi:hypothetical protein LXA43DRAFT_99960 [Ganoderma leucocontextum]|nr:hypothetical protein LXA43DRAFT_99960 [Ganoderma leucocontextum]
MPDAPSSPFAILRRRRLSPPILARLLQQMLEITNSRQCASRSFVQTEADDQRCHIEWLADHDVHAFQSYVQSVSPPSLAIAVGSLPSPLTWGFRTGDSDLLYYEARALTLFMPATVTRITFDEVHVGLHMLEIELSPLMLRDVLGLHYFATLAHPFNACFPLRVSVTSFLTENDNFVIPDDVLDRDISWLDVFEDDYLFAELEVVRVFTSEDTWNIQYNLITATRLATTA